MSNVINPHDAIFKQVLGKPELATEFLSQHLPEAILAELELTTLVEQKESFVDDTLRQHFSDLLYKVQTKARAEVYIYLLFEHKSYPDPDVIFQLLRYKVRIWETAKTAKLGRLPIVSLVVYHGVQTWNIPRNFAESIDWPEDDQSQLRLLRSYVPDFSYHLVDLSAISDEQIRGSVWLRVFQLLLKHIFDPTLGEQLYGILSFVKDLLDKPTGIEMLSTFLRYVGQAGVGVNRQEIEQTVRRLFPIEGGALMKTAFDEFVAIGMQKGEVIGIQKGEVIGIQKGVIQNQRQTILQILQHRFDPNAEIMAVLTTQLTEIASTEVLRMLMDAALQAFDINIFMQQLQQVRSAPT